MQTLDLQRKIRALDHIDKRELKSLEESLRAEQRITARGGQDRMPSLNLDLKPRVHSAALHKAQNRYRAAFVQEFAEAAGKHKEASENIKLAEEFERAAGDSKAGDDGRGSSEGPNPVSRSRSDRKRQRRRKRHKDRNH